MNNAQFAVLNERLEHLVRAMEEIRPLVVNVNSLQHSIDVMQTQIKQLTMGSDARGKLMHDIDKRVLVLERWHKAMVGFSAFAMSILLALGGYTKSFIETVQDGRNDTNQRLATLELIVNSPNYGKAMSRLQEQEVAQ